MARDLLRHLFPRGGGGKQGQAMWHLLPNATAASTQLQMSLPLVGLAPGPASSSAPLLPATPHLQEAQQAWTHGDSTVAAVSASPPRLKPFSPQSPSPASSACRLPLVFQAAAIWESRGRLWREEWGVCSMHGLGLKEGKMGARKRLRHTQGGVVQWEGAGGGAMRRGGDRCSAWGLCRGNCNTSFETQPQHVVGATPHNNGKGRGKGGKGQENKMNWRGKGQGRCSRTTTGGLPMRCRVIGVVLQNRAQRQAQ